MQDIRSKYVPPALNETAFNCPHCGALAKQFWHSLHAKNLGKDHIPRIVTDDQIPGILDKIEDEERRNELLAQLKKTASGQPCLLSSRSDVWNVPRVDNLFISECFNCGNIVIWIYNSLMYPKRGIAPAPNPDLPDDVRVDYDEAGTILDESPRGAAALLRLCIQKLCKHLGESGENVNDDVKKLVKKGLDPRVQQALDVVRVVGNHAVHPGQIDLRDNRETAEKLFGLVNLIAEIMISQPNHVKEIYNSLPKSELERIEKRDRKK